MGMRVRLQHLALLFTALPGLIASRRQRALFRRMWAFSRVLPAQLQAPPQIALQRLTPENRTEAVPAHVIRRLADLVAVLDRRSPLGLCLRRSALRYHFLRQAGMPVEIHFGARLDGPSARRQLKGHAWLTLHGQPYYEADENWRGFTPVFTWPE